MNLKRIKDFIEYHEYDIARIYFFVMIPIVMIIVWIIVSLPDL